MPDDICSQYSVNCRDHADVLKESLLSVAGLSELYKVLADETRIKILYLLSQKELCVCDLAFLLDTSLPVISHHLRLLRALRLVSNRREGKMVFYRLNDNHVLALIEQAKEHYIDRM